VPVYRQGDGCEEYDHAENTAMVSCVLGIEIGKRLLVIDCFVAHFL